MSNRSKSINASKLDPNMTIEATADHSLRWLSPLEAPFHIAGFAWFEQEQRYRRLPSSPAETLPIEVDLLANCTAGGQIRFHTNSSRLSLRVKLAGPSDMYHMTATGQSGFDCYLGEPGNQRYFGTTRFDARSSEYEAPLYDWKEKREFTVTLNFPLYQGVEEVWVGMDPDAAIGEAPRYASDKRIIVYGTSITQGGCASRPGMAYTNILSRSIPQEFINLGFSGNGKGQPAVARTIAQIANPSLLILDYEANSGTAEELSATLAPFIQLYRERHPVVPILVVSKIPYATEPFDPAMARLSDNRKRIQRETVKRLCREGDAHLHFMDGSRLLLTDAEECTVDGVHPTDLGFMQMARSLAPVIKKLC